MAFSKDPERQVVSQAKAIMAGVRRLVPGSLKPKYAQFVSNAIGERTAHLGWSAKPGEEQETRLSGQDLCPLLRWQAQIPVRRRGPAAGRWLAGDRKGVDPDMLGGVLNTAAYFGGRSFFDSLLRELKKIGDRQQREIVIGALGASRDPKVAQSAMDLVLHSDIDPQESVNLLFGPLANLETQGSLPSGSSRRTTTR